MKKFLFVAVCLVLSSCGGTKASSEPLGSAGAIRTSSTCFHGWVSQKGNSYPTGYCKQAANGKSKYLESSIEVDFPTQNLYVHGALRNPDGSLAKWLSSFKVTSCKDIANGWTVVNGENTSTGEKYVLQQREIKEIPPLGTAKQSFEGEAKLSVEIAGQNYAADLSCIRHVF